VSYTVAQNTKEHTNTHTTHTHTYTGTHLSGGVEDKDDAIKARVGPIEATVKVECARKTVNKPTLAFLSEKAREGTLRGGVEEEKGFDPENLPRNQRGRIREGNAESNEPTPTRCRHGMSGTQ